MYTRRLDVVGVAATVQVSLELVVTAVAIREPDPSVRSVGVGVVGMDIDG